MTEPRWLSADEQHSWLHFIGVVELLPGALDTQLGNDAGITHYEYLVMAVLSESPGRSLRMTDLATRTNATLPRLSRVVLGLEQRGYVERMSHPGDRRAKIAKLSDAGMSFLEETAPGHVAKVRELIVDALTPEEFSTLGRISQKLLGRIDPEDRFGVHRVASAASPGDAEPLARLGKRARRGGQPGAPACSPRRRTSRRRHPRGRPRRTRTLAARALTARYGTRPSAARTTRACLTLLGGCEVGLARHAACHGPLAEVMRVGGDRQEGRELVLERHASQDLRRGVEAVPLEPRRVAEHTLEQ